MFPDLLMKFTVADLVDVKTTDTRCDKIEDQHKYLVAQITQSDSASTKTIDTIQANISALLASQESLQAEIEKLKTVNECLSLTVNSFYDDIENGKGQMKAKAPARKPPLKKPRERSSSSRPQSYQQ